MGDWRGGRARGGNDDNDDSDRNLPTVPPL
jgi:hypothetical protein